MTRARASAAAAIALAVAASLAAQQPSKPPSPPGQDAPDDGTWNRRISAAGDYRTVLEVSGREEVGRFMERPPDPENLRSICDTKRQAVDVTVSATEHYLASLLAKPIAQQDVRDIIWTRKSLGQLRGYQGDMTGAVEQFAAAYRAAVQYAAKYPELAPARSYLAALLGVSELRRGELENCIGGHASASCIVPIAKAGLHHAPSGSQNAAKYLTEYLREHPDDLDMRWLLNVSHMTLGTYPDAVPKEYRIRSVGVHIGRRPRPLHGRRGTRRDWAHRARRRRHHRRLRQRRPLRRRPLQPRTRATPLRYLPQRAATATFEDVYRAAQASRTRPAASTSRTPTSTTTAGSTSTCMRGGWEYPMRNSLLRNNRRRHVRRRDREGGLLDSAPHRTHTAAWADYDNDGWVDLFVGHEESPSALYHNERDGTFRGGRRRRPASRARPSPRARRGATTTTTASRPVRLELRRAELPLPQPQERHVRRTSRRRSASTCRS